jgi:hypothetical protein
MTVFATPRRRGRRLALGARLFIGSPIGALSLLLSTLVCGGAAANPSFPIPLKTAPDWHGVTSALPSPLPAAYLTSWRVSGRPVVLVQLFARTTLSEESTARMAYGVVFKNTGRFPPGAIFVVVNVFERAPGLVVFLKYGYVFYRDSEKKWQPRPIPKRDLDAMTRLVLPPPL